MYEKPKLNRVGEAQEVILGILFPGDDLDMTYVPGGGGGGQYADDGDGSQGAQPRT